MSGKYKVDKNDILLKNLDDKLRKLISVITILKENKFFSYKLVFKNIELVHIKNITVDSVTGNIEGGNTVGRIKKGIEVTYHPDGKLMFKDIEKNENFIKENYCPVVKLKEPKIFLQIACLPLNSLEEVRGGKVGSVILPIKYKDDDFINCDFLIGNSKYERDLYIPAHSKNIFKDGALFKLLNKEQAVIIYTFIYRFQGSSERTYLSVPSRKFLSKLSKVIYCFRVGRGRLVIKDWIFAIYNCLSDKIKSIKPRK